MTQPTSQPEFVMVLRGYDRAQVDAALASVRDERDAAVARVEALERRLAEVTAHARPVEDAAQPAEEEPSAAVAEVQRLQQQNAELAAELDAERRRGSEEAEALLARVAARAQEHADAVVAAAEAEARALLEQSRERAREVEAWADGVQERASLARVAAVELVGDLQAVLAADGASAPAARRGGAAG